MASVGQNNAIEASALISIDRGRGALTWEVGRGPLWTNESAVGELLEVMESSAKNEGVTAIFLSPTTPLPYRKNWQPSKRRKHCQATRMIDLTQSEETIMAGMHQKGRYNIRVAEKAGVTIRRGTGSDIDTFYDLLKATGGRDGFKISRKSHYSRFLTDLQGSFLLVAEHKKKPIAGLLGVIWNGTGIYYYGASQYEQRALMAPYLLQWEAMKLCKAAGCVTYDLLGIAPEGVINDPWSGISEFKRKFGGVIITYPPEQMLVLQPVRKFIIDLKRRLLG